MLFLLFASQIEVIINGFEVFLKQQTIADSQPDGGDIVESPIMTLIKLLSNIVKYPDDTKYKRIRTNNPNLKKKMATLDGLIYILEFIKLFLCH